MFDLKKIQQKLYDYFIKFYYKTLSKRFNEIKAEICIKNNFNMDCIEFKSYVKNDEKLLKSVKSNQKYN